MSSLIFVFVVGLYTPGVVVTQFNGRPSLDPNGQNVCEYARSFVSYKAVTAVYPNAANRQRRQASSEEEAFGTAGSGVKFHTSYIPDLWASHQSNGASYQQMDSPSEQRPIITDFFEYGCCQGWEQDGVACTIALCDTACLYGKCTSPNTCTCNPGWKGSSCNERCESGDSSGNCGGPYACDPISHDCKCLPGYTGNMCNIPCPVGTYGPGCTGRCKCTDKMNKNNTCDRYSGECPTFEKSHVNHINRQSVINTTERNAHVTGVPSIHISSTQAPRMVVHEAISTMKVVFLAGVAVVALIGIIAGLTYRRMKRQTTRNKGSFFERKKSWGALVINELNEVNERRRKARQAEVFHNPPESVYDNPPTPPSRRHTYLDSIDDTLTRNNMYAPDGQDADTTTTNFNSLNSEDVQPIVVPEDESIYEVHDCGAPTATSIARLDSLYTNDNVFSVIKRCKALDNSLLTPVANAIESSESEYDYPYADFDDSYRTATEPRQHRRKRFGSRDRRMRKGSSDGQMYSVLIRPDIEAVSYQKQSYSDSFGHAGYASRIDRTDDHSGYSNTIDSNTDLYSATSNQILIGNSWYSKPRESSNSQNGMLALPAPEGDKDYSRDSSQSNNQFALGYLTSVKKMPSIVVSPTNPSHFDYQPPVPDHYQTSSILQRNLFRHQFQTVHEKPNKPTTISVVSPARLARPNCLPISKYHDYVNGKVLSKPPLPRRNIPAHPAARRRPCTLQEEDAAHGPDSNATCTSLPIPNSRLEFPSPDDLDSDNYLSLRFSERAHPMKPSSNI